MVKKAKLAILFLAFLLCHPLMAKRPIPDLLDSIFCIADEQKGKVWHVESDYYFNSSQNLLRKNILARFTSCSSDLRKNRSTQYELTGHMTLMGKDYYSTKSLTHYETIPNANIVVEDNAEFLSISIYDPFMLDRRLLSPLCRCNKHYYKYSLVSVTKSDYIYVTFVPKHKHQQLVSGHFIYDRNRKYVKSISINGDNAMTRFSYEAIMGSVGEARFWPQKIELSYRYRYFGNIIEGRASLYHQYSFMQPNYKFKYDNLNKNDLSHLYNRKEDKAKVLLDSLAIAELRNVTMSNDDQKRPDGSYAQHQNDSISSKVFHKNTNNMKRLTKALETIAGTIFESNDITLSKATSLEFSHLDINYSGSKGVTLREDIELSHTSTKGRTFSFTPNLGYYFRPKQFVWNIKTEYEYSPKLFGRLSLNIGSRSITNSTDRLRSYETGQTLEREDDAQSILFNERYAEFYHSIEPLNGLSFLFGTIFRQRTVHRMTDEKRESLHLNKYHNSFVPHIAVTYTPGQKYYIKNGRKYVLGSKYPTFTLDLERGVRRAFSTDSHYEKWEAEASQVLHVTPTQNFVWKAGYGMFTNAEEVNFISYRNFNNGVVDYNWKDQRSGVFQLLDSKYYYDSPHYFRMHFVFESPALLLTFFSQRLIHSERFYSNTLFTEGLAPYIELGYGFSTLYCDFGFFASYANKQKFKSGVKFSLHL